ncbi:putative solute-binding protein, partial [Siminovitchia fortis]|uniref:putative solute-binding protein n=2 Tax=Bacteria TaxID=2 RepID=UPI001C9495AD
KGKILLAASLFLFAHSAQAKVDICIFDLLGKAGESYKLMEDWLLASKNWNADVGLKIVADEAQAEREFRAGNCDGVYMTSIRARAFNKFAGSIDALGGVPSNAIAQKAISY